MEPFFYISAAVAVFATLMVITRKHAMHALLYLVVSLLAVALVFYSLGAAFAAALEAIVNAGAIMVLFVFVLMFFDLGKEGVRQERQWLPARAWIGPGILAAVLLTLLAHALWSGQNGSPQAGARIEPEEVGLALMGPYVVGVELAAMLLLSALVGVLHLVGKKSEGVGCAGSAPEGQVLHTEAKTEAPETKSQDRQSGSDTETLENAP